MTTGIPRLSPPTTVAENRRSALRRPTLWYFLIPAGAFYAFVVLVPALRGSFLAFTDWDGISASMNLVGLDQFRAVLADGKARAAIGNTFTVALTVTVLQNLFGLLLALAVNSMIRSRNLLRILFFAPAVITPVAVSYLWKNLLSPGGTINQSLSALGLGWLEQNWLGDPQLAIWSVSFVIIWQFAGYSMVIFLANLQSIPEEMIEAAHLDGAGAFQRFFYVVRPELAPSMTVNLMLSITAGLKVFDKVYVITGGGPGGATETMSTLVYKSAFQFGEFGYAIALAVVLTVIVATVSTVQYKLLQRQGSGASDA